MVIDSPTMGKPGNESFPHATESAQGGIRLLVVEDDALMLESISELLRLNNFQVIPAVNGRTALQLSRTTQPHCILMDLKLPDIDGNTVLYRLKHNKLTRDIPVVVLSGCYLPDALQHTMALGAAAYVRKPFDIPQLLEMIWQISHSG